MSHSQVLGVRISTYGFWRAHISKPTMIFRRDGFLVRLWKMTRVSSASLQVPPMSFVSICTKMNGELTLKSCKLHERRDCACLINQDSLQEQYVAWGGNVLNKKRMNKGPESSILGNDIPLFFLRPTLPLGNNLMSAFRVRGNA